MVKYSIELKQRVIQDYLSGKGGSTYLAKLHNVGSSSQVRSWIRNYRAEGLPAAHSKVNKNYSMELKENAGFFYFLSYLKCYNYWVSKLKK